jgi:hypothetical protein
VQPLDPIVGGQSLRIPSIHSPNFVAGVQGWTINIDGSAEFNNLSIRGTFMGIDYEINSSGAFFYSGTPAAGNLIASIAPAGGGDEFGNAYVSGFSTYFLDGIVATTMTPTLGGFAGVSAIVSYSDDPPATQAASALANGALIISGTPDITGAVSSMQALWNGDAVDFQIFDNAGFDGTVNLQTTNSGAAWSMQGGNWQTPSYNTNWAGSTTFGTLTGLQTLHYRITAEDELEIGGCFAAGSTAPGTAIMNVPAMYRPLSAYPVACQKITGGVSTPSMLYVSTAGNLNINSQLGSSVTASAQYIIPPQCIPLGSLL